MKEKVVLLYEDLTYKVRGAIFGVHQVLGSGHKESIYHKALAEEFKRQNINFVEEKAISVEYQGAKIGVYRPDFIIDDKIVVEIKATPFLTLNCKEQIQHYLSGSEYRLGLLVNFGSRRAEIRRIIYDLKRSF